MYQDWMEKVPLDVNKNKSNSGCEYCEKEKKFSESEEDNIKFQIYGRHLRFFGKILSFSVGRDILINYCPMCGRKLV